MTITVNQTVSMGHRLPSYDGLCSSLHGHNLRITATVEVGDEFLDFKQVDTLWSWWIQTRCCQCCTSWTCACWP